MAGEKADMGRNLVKEAAFAEFFLIERGPRGSLGNVLNSIPVDPSGSGMELHAKRAACFIGAAADRIKGSVGPGEAAAFLAVVSTGVLWCVVRDRAVSHSLVMDQEKAANAFEGIYKDYLEGRKVRGSIKFCFIDQDCEDQDYPFFIERRGGLPEDVPLEKVSFDNFPKVWESARDVMRISREMEKLLNSLADEKGRIPEEYGDLINDRFNQLLEQDTLS